MPIGREIWASPLVSLPLFFAGGIIIMQVHLDRTRRMTQDLHHINLRARLLIRREEPKGAPQALPTRYFCPHFDIAILKGKFGWHGQIRDPPPRTDQARRIGKITSIWRLHCFPARLQADHAIAHGDILPAVPL